MRVQLSEFVMQNINPVLNGQDGRYLQCRDITMNCNLLWPGTKFSKNPYERTIQIFPQEGSIIKMILKPAGIKLSREYSGMVHLQ